MGRSEHKWTKWNKVDWMDKIGLYGWMVRKSHFKSSRQRVSLVSHEMAFLAKYSWNIAWHMTLQLSVCTFHVAFCGFLYSWASHEVNRETTLIFIACLILHHLNTKPNTIKSHKIQGNNLLQLQHFLSWNKVNIKYSCKSQLYSLWKNILRCNCVGFG